MLKFEGEDKVVNARGDVIAEKINGEWTSKEPEAIQFIESSTEKVRARNSKGHYVKDDPTTPENEAWTTKVKKKISRKKKKAD